MRGTQKYFMSSEIYVAQNRYGRYQSYGALELLYYGGVANSGEQLAGWGGQDVSHRGPSFSFKVGCPLDLTGDGGRLRGGGPPRL